MASLWGGYDEESRTTTWLNVLPGTKDFPLFGTGYGAFRLVEPLSAGLASDPALEWDHAHNEYVEAWSRGGGVRLTLTLLAIVLTFRLGLQALILQRGRPVAGLIVGRRAAWTTVVIHSFVDFGIHIPAIALLTTVVGAHLAGLGAGGGLPEAAEAPSLRLGGTVALLGASAVVALGVLIVGAGWRMDEADRAARSARRLARTEGDQAREQQLQLLRAAVARTPDDAELHTALADAYMQAGNERAAEEGDDARFVLPALRHYREARDLCPLLPGPQVRLASLVDYFERADPRRLYLDRAKSG